MLTVSSLARHERKRADCPVLSAGCGRDSITRKRLSDAARAMARRFLPVEPGHGDQEDRPLGSCADRYRAMPGVCAANQSTPARDAITACPRLSPPSFGGT